MIARERSAVLALEKMVEARALELLSARETAEGAESASRAKSAFLAGMSHELRSPLNEILGMHDFALEMAVDPGQIEALNRSRAAAKQLLSVINDILDLAKLESDRLTLQVKSFELVPAVDGVIDMQHASAHLKGVRLSSQIDPLLPAFFWGDAFRFRQVLLNFVSNAIKFCERGEVVVRVTSMENDADSTLLRIEIDVGGMGIRPAEEARLLLAFAHPDGALARKFGGTGLGFVISQRIAQLMGGEAGMEQTHGVGSMFWFTARLLTKPPPSAHPDH